MITARKMRKTIDDIPIIYEGKEMTFGDLEDDKQYYVLITNSDPGSKYLLLGGTKRAVLDSLIKFHIADREALEFLDYKIRIKCGGKLTVKKP